MSELRGYKPRVPSFRSEYTENFRWSVWLQYSFVKEPTSYALAWDEQDALGLMSRFVDKVLADGAKYNQENTAEKDGRWSWVVTNHTNGNTIRVWVQEDIAEEQKEQVDVTSEDEAEPVKHARWVPSDNRHWVTCPFCGADIDVSCGILIYVDGNRADHINFCPNCGVEMDGVIEE